jgi:molybdopterin converting factor small subunit
VSHLLLQGPLRDAAGGRSGVRLDAPDLKALFELLRRRMPEVADRVLGEDGRIRMHVNVFINGRLHPSKQIDSIPIGPDDEVLILPAISGG